MSQSLVATTGIIPCWSSLIPLEWIKKSVLNAVFVFAAWRDTDQAPDLPALMLSPEDRQQLANCLDAFKRQGILRRDLLYRFSDEERLVYCEIVLFRGLFEIVSVTRERQFHLDRWLACHISDCHSRLFEADPAPSLAAHLQEFISSLWQPISTPAAYPFPMAA